MFCWCVPYSKPFVLWHPVSCSKYHNPTIALENICKIKVYAKSNYFHHVCRVLYHLQRTSDNGPKWRSPSGQLLQFGKWFTLLGRSWVYVNMARTGPVVQGREATEPWCGYGEHNLATEHIGVGCQRRTCAALAQTASCWTSKITDCTSSCGW